MNMTIRSCVTRLLVLLASILFYGVVMADTDTQSVYTFDAAMADTGGKSHLTRTDMMILITLEAAELVPGDAHTLWWVVFNNPAGCSEPCGEDDIFNMDGSLNVEGVLAAEIAVGNASGNVAKSDGTLEFGARMRSGVPNYGHQVLFTPSLLGGGPPGPLLTADPHDAEVHVIVQTHGQGRGGKKLREQLSMVEANCTPECADIQFSVHLP